MDDQRKDLVWRGLAKLHYSVSGVDASVLDEVTVARHLDLEAHRAFEYRVRAARAAGHGWDRIAEHVPGFPAAYGPEAGQQLFETLAHAGAALGERSVYWRCGDCEGLVVDHGPAIGHPAAVERGHAEGCGRFRDDVDRYIAQRLESPSPNVASNGIGYAGRPPALDVGPDLGL